MAYTLEAALLTEIGKPLILATLEMAPLQYGQVFVRILASGICGAQLKEIDGSKDSNQPLPRPLGHEGVGVVEFVGPAVTKVKAGDKVIMHWRKGEGIESPFPEYTIRDDLGPRISGGKVTTFMDYAVVSENRLTPVPQDTPDDLCVLLGCGLSTALGTIESEACVKFGESVLIIGCGGLGLNLILAAKLAQAGRINAIDIKDKSRIAATMGADFFGIDGQYDVIIETSGSWQALAYCTRTLAPSGRLVMVGQPPEPTNMILGGHLWDMFSGTGKTIKATQGGKFNPTRDIPRYLAMFRKQPGLIDGIVTHRVKLAEINDGLYLVRNGEAGRVLVEMA